MLTRIELKARNKGSSERDKSELRQSLKLLKMATVEQTVSPKYSPECLQQSSFFTYPMWCKDNRRQAKIKAFRWHGRGLIVTQLLPRLSAFSVWQRSFSPSHLNRISEMKFKVITAQLCWPDYRLLNRKIIYRLSTWTRLHLADVVNFFLFPPIPWFWIVQFDF